MQVQNASLKDLECKDPRLALIVTALVIFVALGTLMVWHLYALGGIYWDFIAHMLYAKALLNPAFYSDIANHSIISAINYENEFYVESFRAPLMSVLMIPFVAAFGSNAPPFYILFELVLLGIAALYLSKAFGTNPFLSLAIFFTPYVLVYLTVLNGAEILSMILLVFGVSMLAGKKWQSGIVLALAGLAKYFSAIFILLLFVLPKEQRRRAFGAYIGTTTIWLVANYIIFGNPIFSYLQSLYEVFVVYKVAASTVAGAISYSFQIIFADIILFAVFALLLALYYRKRFIKKGFLEYAKSLEYKDKTALAFFFVSVFALLLVSYHASINGLPRWGYVIYSSSALVILLVFAKLSRVENSVRSKGLKPTKLLSYALIAFVIMLIGYQYFTMETSFPFAGYGTRNVTMLNAVSTVYSLGLGNCSVISNAWVYLKYYGIMAHYPYYYNSSMHEYPIILFDNIGINKSLVNTTGIQKSVDGNGYVIDYPKDYICAKFQ